MPPSEAKKRANRKWDEAHRADYWRCTIVFPAQEREAIQARAEELGIPVSEYIRSLIREDLSTGQDGSKHA